MLTEYRIIAHTIGYQSRDELAGRTRKLSQAENRAREVAETMKQEGKTGYVVIRDHIQRAIAQTYFVTGQQDMDDESKKHDASEDAPDEIDITSGGDSTRQNHTPRRRKSKGNSATAG